MAGEIQKAINNETAHPIQLYLLDPDGKPIPAQADEDGYLKVGGITLEGDILTNSEFVEADTLDQEWPLITQTTISGAVLMLKNGTGFSPVEESNPIPFHGNVASGETDSGNPLKIGGVVVDPTSLPSSLTVGQRSDIATSRQKEALVYFSRLFAGEDQTNNVLAVIHKKIASGNYCASLFVDYGVNVTLNIKASGGNVYALSCRNLSGSNRWLQLHNTATVPGGGAVPRNKFLVPPGQQIIVGSDFFTSEGINYSNGIAFAFSTTETTYTPGIAADQNTEVVYI